MYPIRQFQGDICQNMDAQEFPKVQLLKGGSHKTEFSTKKLVMAHLVSIHEGVISKQASERCNEAAMMSSRLGKSSKRNDTTH